MPPWITSHPLTCVSLTKASDLKLVRPILWGSYPLNSLLLGLMSTRVSLLLGQSGWGLFLPQWCACALCVRVKLWWFSSGPLHPCIWETEQTVAVFFPPWELITALFPISPIVTFHEPGAVSFWISLPTTGPPATMPNYSHLCKMPRLSACGKAATISFSSTLRRISGLFPFVSFCWSWWWAVWCSGEAAGVMCLHLGLIPPISCLTFHFTVGNGDISLVTNTTK